MKPGVGLKMLLSPIERRQPWKLYLLPGVLLNYLLSILVGIYSAHFLTVYLRSFAMNHELGGWKLLLLELTVPLIPATLLTPLMVTQARLAVQRIRSEGDENTDIAVIASGVGIEPYSTEDVIKYVRLSSACFDYLTRVLLV